MSDLKKYINKRKKKDPKSFDGFEEGYEAFKIGVLLRKAREKSGFTQQKVATKLHTKRSAISRIENHGENIRLSTLERFANAVGKKMTIILR